MTHSPESIPGRDRTLHQAFESLIQLHAQSSGEITEQRAVIDRMRKHLGQTTLRVLDFYVDAERVRRGVSKDDDTMIQFEFDLTEQELQEYLQDAQLTMEGDSIHAKEYGRILVNRYLRRAVSARSSPESLRGVAVIFFDGNGQKSMNDCTSVPTGTRYLRQVSKFFLNTEGSTRRYIRDTLRCSDVTPLTAGGDEFCILLQREEPFSDEELQEVIGRYQAELESEPSLVNFIDFNDEALLIRYGFRSEKDRKAFLALPPELRSAKLREIRSQLPEKFIATFAGGAARLDEAVIAAYSGTAFDCGEEPETFDTARAAIFDMLLTIANAREADNKREFIHALWDRDPRMASFIARTERVRVLEQLLHESRLQIAALTAAKGKSEGEMD